MGRNQYDITDEDLRGLREAFERTATLTPEERAAERAKEKAELKARQKVAKEEKARIEAEQELQRRAQIERANEIFRAAGLGELTTEPIDPHFEMDHPQYLQTPLWQRIRRRVLKRDGHLCQVCGAVAKEVHHRSYEYDVIIGKNDAGCISLCGTCHQRVEFTPEGKHRSVQEKEAFLCALLKKI